MDIEKEIEELQATPVNVDDEGVQDKEAVHDIMFKVILIGDQSVGKSSTAKSK